MGKRLSLLWLPCALAFALVLALPYSALTASKFSVTVERDVCQSGAGKYGYGHGQLRVRVIEYGKSGANKFTYLARVWHRGLHRTEWSKEYVWPRSDMAFPNNRASYWNSRSFSYDPKHDAYHRIVVIVRAWHNDELLFSRSVYGAIC
jgi:hypothetical protein